MKDTSGAIMTTSLFMCIFLIGTLWYLIGIGDAIIFREHVQQGTDAVAFTSAAYHARGMNFIAALNLVIFAIFALYIVLVTVAGVLDAFGFLCEILQWGRFLPVPGVNQLGWAAFGEVKARDAADTARNTYVNTVVLKALPALGKAQTATAIGAPAVAELASVYNGKQNGVLGLSASLSMIPGGAINLGLNKVKLPGPLPKEGEEKSDGTALNHARLGLPVVEQDFSGACGSVVTTYMNLGGPLPTLPSWSPQNTGNEALAKKELQDPNLKDDVNFKPIYDATLGKITEILKGIVLEGVISQFYCPVKEAGQKLQISFLPDTDWIIPHAPRALQDTINTIRPLVPPGVPFFGKTIYDFPEPTFFGRTGAKQIWGPATNGSDWMQVWGISFDQFEDSSSPRVAIIGNKRDGKVAPTSNPYVAQAEFYFPCKSGEACGAIMVYSMRWQARLRRVHPIDFQKDAGDVAIDALFDPIINLIKDRISKKTTVGKKLTDALNKVKQSNEAQGEAGSWTWWFVDQVKSRVQGQIIEPIKETVTPEEAEDLEDQRMLH